MPDKVSTATRTSGGANGAAAGESLVSRLAGFFPGAVAVRIPIKITVSSVEFQVSIRNARHSTSGANRNIEIQKKRDPKMYSPQQPQNLHPTNAKTGPSRGPRTGACWEPWPGINPKFEFGIFWD